MADEEDRERCFFPGSLRCCLFAGGLSVEEEESFTGSHHLPSCLNSGSSREKGKGEGEEVVVAVEETVVRCVLGAGAGLEGVEEGVTVTDVAIALVGVVAVVVVAAVELAVGTLLQL